MLMNVGCISEGARTGFDKNLEGKKEKKDFLT